MVIIAVSQPRARPQIATGKSYLGMECSDTSRPTHFMQFALGPFFAEFAGFFGRRAHHRVESLDRLGASMVANFHSARTGTTPPRLSEG